MRKRILRRFKRISFKNCIIYQIENKNAADAILDKNNLNMVIINSTPTAAFSAMPQCDPATTTGGNLTGYMRSKSILELRTSVPQSVIYNVSVSINSGTTRSVGYYSDTNGRLVISLKKFMQQAGNGGNVSLTITTDISSTTYTITTAIRVVNGISYADIFAPKVKGYGVFAGINDCDIVLPPNVILCPSQGEGVIFESNFVASEDDLWVQGSSGLEAAMSAQGSRKNYYSVNAEADYFRFYNDDGELRWNLSKVDDCANVIVVRWTSLTGAVRQHYFEFVGNERGNDSETSMMTAGDGYVVRKSPYIGGKIRINGLTPYGVWYYADLLQASDVHAIVKPNASWSFEDEIASEQSAAYVSGNETVTPDGNGFYTFEAAIKLRHYDSI